MIVITSRRELEMINQTLYPKLDSTKRTGDIFITSFMSNLRKYGIHCQPVAWHRFPLFNVASAAMGTHLKGKMTFKKESR
jgi:hypothetical protein